MHQLLVCASCHGTERAQFLVNQLAMALPDFDIGTVACMSGCTRPGTIAFCASGKASYLFGDIDPDAAVTDIVVFAHAYQAAPKGWITDAREFGALRTGAIARIPVAPER